MEELLKKILIELRKTNRQLESIKELLSQQDEIEDEEEDHEENNTYRTLDGGFYNG